MTSSPKQSGFEKKDIQFGPLVVLIGLLLMFLGGSLLSMRFLNHFLTRTAPLREEPPSPLADMHRRPPEPRLQVDAALDLIRMRDVENVTLNNYAWIDETAGRVRIPIARAMAILAEKGLPARKASTE